VRRPVSRLRDRISLVSCRLEPGLFRYEDLAQSLLRGVPERGTVGEVGDIGHVATILVAPEDVDVVVSHGNSSGSKWYFSTSDRNCLI